MCGLHGQGLRSHPRDGGVHKLLVPKAKLPSESLRDVWLMCRGVVFLVAAISVPTGGTRMASLASVYPGSVRCSELSAMRTSVVYLILSHLDSSEESLSDPSDRSMAGSSNSRTATCSVAAWMATPCLIQHCSHER